MVEFTKVCTLARLLAEEADRYSASNSRSTTSLPERVDKARHTFNSTVLEMECTEPSIITAFTMPE